MFKLKSVLLQGLLLASLAVIPVSAFADNSSTNSVAVDANQGHENLAWRGGGWGHGYRGGYYWGGRGYGGGYYGGGYYTPYYNYYPYYSPYYYNYYYY